MTEPLSPADEINAERREVFKDSKKINEMIEDEIKVLKEKEDEEGLPQDFRLSDYASDHLKFKVWTLMENGQSREVIDHLIDAYCVGYYDGIYDAHLARAVGPSLSEQSLPFGIFLIGFAIED